MSKTKLVVVENIVVSNEFADFAVDEVFKNFRHYA